MDELWRCEVKKVDVEDHRLCEVSKIGKSIESEGRLADVLSEEGYGEQLLTGTVSFPSEENDLELTVVAVWPCEYTELAYH